MYIVLSHFIFEINNNIIRDSDIFATSNILFSFIIFDNKINVFPANYYYLKLSAIKAFYDSPLFGVGIGNFNIFLENLKQLDIYPNSFPNWDPHSTLLGAASEQGILGLIVTSFFLIYAVFINYKKLDSQYAFVRNALLAYFIYIFIDSICLDIMNFRFVWIAFILSIFLSQQKIILSSRQ